MLSLVYTAQKLLVRNPMNKGISTEIVAGISTFVTMAYIVIIAPQILHASGMNEGAAFVATALVTAFGCILLGLVSNMPIALAPGLGLLSYFGYVVTAQLGYTWQAGIAAVAIAGVVFFFLTITPIRRWILMSIPDSLGKSIAGGIGFFIGFIALKNVGVIIHNADTLVALGNLVNVKTGLFFLGFIIIAILEGRKVPGSILIGMIVVSVIGWVFKVVPFHGVFSLPPSIAPSFWQANFHAILNVHAIPVVFTFLIVALFDSTGTIIGLSHHMDVKRDKALYKKMNKALLAESCATLVASTVGVTTTSPFVESAAGIRAGGKTGITAITVGVLFLCLLFFAPVATSIPAYATSAALFYVACLMVKPFASVDWEHSNEYIPATITLLAIPLTFSIADGVGLGLLCYLVLTVAAGKWKQIHPMIWGLSALFVVYFVAAGMS